MGHMPVSSVAITCSSSSGIGYEFLVSVFVEEGGTFAYKSTDLELVCFVLLLDHEQCMVKQKYQKLSAIALRTTTAL
jgi:hypothetical protein